MSSTFYLPAFFGAIGLSCLYSGFCNLKKSFQSTKWKKVNGIITKSKEIKILEFSENITSEIEPDIYYEYSVNSKMFSNNKIFNIDNNTYTYKETKAILNKYPKKKYVSIYYDETNPNESFLIKTSIVPIYITILAGFSLVLFATFVWIAI